MIRIKRALGLRALICFLAAIAPYGFGAQGNNQVELQRVLHQMDEAGKTLKSFKARFSQTKYTFVLKDFDKPQTGDFYYAITRKGPALRQEVTSSGKKILTVKEKKAIFYQPEIKEAKIVNLTGKYENIAEYLTIGLGKSPAKLENFNLSYQGSDPVNKESCSVLLLTPKSKSRFDSITLWIRPNGIAAQIKFLEPNRDYSLLTYSEEKINIPMPESKFDQVLPKDVEIQYLQ
jgi:outer membrane lipoprotein-sorting protein